MPGLFDGIDLASILEGMVDRIGSDPVRAKERMDGDEFTQRMWAVSRSSLIAAMPLMEYCEDIEYYKRVKLVPLGVIPYHKATIGPVSCERAAYLGHNGNIYIFGPRKQLGKVVVDLHPYSIEDAMGWGGVGLKDIYELTLPYFI